MYEDVAAGPRDFVGFDGRLSPFWSVISCIWMSGGPMDDVAA